MHYFIGDIHGHADKLQSLLSKLDLTNQDTLIFLGDYIDRGPQVKESLELLMSLPNSIFLRGNHEQWMLGLMDGVHGVDDQILVSFNDWLSYGGIDTVSQLGRSVDVKYINFISKTCSFVEGDKFIAAHAGVSFKDPKSSSSHQLYMSRNCAPSLRYKKTFINGHTPTHIKEINKQAGKVYKGRDNHITIDNGVYVDKPGFGNIVAFCLETAQILVSD